jgi:TonB family protein
MFTALLIAGLTALWSLAAEEVKVTRHGKQWPMKYEEDYDTGAVALRRGTKLKVAVGAERIVGQTKKGEVVFSIPVASVFDVIYDNQTQRRSTPVLKETKKLFTEGALAKSGVAWYKWGEYDKALAACHRTAFDAYRAAAKSNPDASPIFGNPDMAAQIIDLNSTIAVQPATELQYNAAIAACRKAQMLKPVSDEAVAKLAELCRQWQGHRCEPTILFGEVVYGVGALMTAGALAPFKTTRHFVSIHWQEGREEKGVVFKVGKGEYVSFLAELERVTGRPWLNLAKELESVRQELKAELEAELEGESERATEEDSYQVGIRPRTYIGNDSTGRLVYTSFISMPNLTSATGSWELRFVELGEVSDGFSAEGLSNEFTPRLRRRGEPNGIPFEAPVVTKKVDLNCLAAGRHLGLEGTVSLSAVIRRDGIVDNIHVVRSAHELLDQSAIEAFRGWRFEPGRKNGAPVDLEVTVDICSA